MSAPNGTTQAVDLTRSAHVRPGSSMLAAAIVAGSGAVLLSVTWITHGLDVTDHGFDLSNQQRAAINAPSYEYSVTWLSDLLGGWWLNLAGDPGLLWARLGAVAGTGVIAALVCLLLGMHFRLRASICAVLATTALLRTNPTGTLDYNNLPMLLLLPGLILLFKSRGNENTGTRQSVCGAVAGMFFGLAIMAKITMFVLLLVPWVMVGTHLWLRGAVRGRDVRSAVWLMVGATGAVSACLVALELHGRLAQYLAVFTGEAGFGTDTLHSLPALLKAYALELGQAARLTLLVVGLCALVLATRLMRLAWTSSRKLRVGGGVLAVAMGTFAAAWALRPDTGSALPDHKGWTAVLAALGLLVVLLVERLAVSPGWRRADLVQLALAGLVVACSGAAGSATGLLSFRESLWVLLPTTILMLPRAVLTLGRRVQAMRTRPRHLHMAVMLLGATVVLGSQALRAVSPYRDARSPSARSEAMRHSKLWGIKTTPERARALDEVLHAMGMFVGRGESILAFGDFCMVYYLTETEPCLGQVWVDGMSPAVLESRLEQMGSRRPLPRVAVQARTNLKSRDWGPGHIAERPDFGGQRRLIHLALEQRGYVEVWSNECFRILAAAPQTNR